MSSKTGIEWTQATWNPVVGCEQVSPGCGLCYAKTIHDMRHKAHQEGKKVAAQYAVPFESVQLKPERLTMPIGWKEGRRIFVNSVSDLFHEAVPFEFIDRVFAVMALTPRHTYQVLTKRPDRMRAYLTQRRPRVLSSVPVSETTQWHIWTACGDFLDARHPSAPWSWSEPFDDLIVGPWPLPNVHLGTSVEDQKRANDRIPDLLKSPAAVHWLSCEPLLGPINFSAIDMGNPLGECDECGDAGLSPCEVCNDVPGIDWVVVGGESGRRSQRVRPMHVDWLSSIQQQCEISDVPFFFKQWGDYLCIDAHSPCVHADIENTWVKLDGKRYTGRDLKTLDSGVIAVRVGKKRAGRQFNGRTWNEFPAVAK